MTILQNTTNAVLLIFLLILCGYLARAALGFRGIYFATLIPVFATPNAAPSFAMVQRMGGDAELAGSIVVMTSLFCPLTIFAWCWLFQVLGLF